MSRATYQLAVDLDNDGLFSTSEALTADVIAAGRSVGGRMASATRGQDVSRVHAPPMAGTLAFRLKDDSAAYGPSSNLVAGRQVRLRATFSGTTYDVFRGILDRPQQVPVGLARREVECQAFGMLSRLAGKKVSTELYSSVRTDTAIGHLLDAAGWPKNAQQYLLDLSPIALWGLGEASGNAIDATGNGYDGTVTIGAGVRDVAALDDAGDGCITFDGASTKVTVADAAGLRALFAGGGTIAFAFNANSDGENNEGTIVQKSSGADGWFVRVSSESAGNVRIIFRHNFATTYGFWQTAVDVPLNSLVVGVLTFDSDNVANNPTLYLYDPTNGFRTLTVGAGLTETSTPVGAASGDAGTDLTIGNDPTSVVTFDGEIDEVEPFGRALTAAQAKGWIARVLDAPRHLDEGKTTLDWWWLDNEDAMQALGSLRNTEGPGAALYEDGTGAIVFKNRHARALDTRSADIQTTFRATAGGTEPLLSAPFTYDPGLKDVVNECTVDVKTRAAQASAQVWALGQTITLAPGETRTYVARQSDGDPFTAAIAPSSGGGDYTVSTGSLASTPSIDRTSGASCTITIGPAGASGATVTGLRMRAQSVEVTNTTLVRSRIDVSESQAQYGVQTYQLPVRAEIGVDEAQDFADAVAGFWKDGRATVRVTVRAGVADARMTAALAREVNDRVRVIAGNVDAEFHVERVTHEIAAPSQHVTVFECSEASVASYWQLDSSLLDGGDVLTW